MILLAAAMIVLLFFGLFLLLILGVQVAVDVRLLFRCLLLFALGRRLVLRL